MQSGNINTHATHQFVHVQRHLRYKCCNFCDCSICCFSQLHISRMTTQHPTLLASDHDLICCTVGIHQPAHIERSVQVYSAGLLISEVNVQPFTCSYVQVWMIDGQPRCLDKLLGRRKKKRSYEYEVAWMNLTSLAFNRRVIAQTQGQQHVSKTEWLGCCCRPDNGCRNISNAGREAEHGITGRVSQGHTL